MQPDTKKQNYKCATSQSIRMLCLLGMNIIVESKRMCRPDTKALANLNHVSIRKSLQAAAAVAL